MENCDIQKEGNVADAIGHLFSKLILACNSENYICSNLGYKWNIRIVSKI